MYVSDEKRKQLVDQMLTFKWLLWIQELGVLEEQLTIASHTYLM